MFYITKNHCFDLKSVRDIAIDRIEKKIYISFKCGDTRDTVLKYDTVEGAEDAFIQMCNRLVNLGGN